MVQRHAAGDDIAASSAEIEIDLEFGTESFDRFSLDQRKFFSRVRPGMIKIAIALEAPSGKCAHFFDRLKWTFRDWRDVN